MANCRCQVRKILLGNILVEIYSVEAPRFCPEVRGGPAHQNLRQEKEGNYQEKLDGCSLAVTSSAGQHVGMDGLSRPLPAEVVEFAESKQHERRANEESDKADGAPKNGIAGRGVAHQRVVRKIVGVGLTLTGTIGNRGPRRPGKKSGQLLQFRAVADIVALQSPVAGRHREVAGPLAYLFSVRCCFRFGEDQSSGPGVIAILFQQEPDFLFDGPPLPSGQVVHAAAEELLSLRFGGINAQCVKVCGRKIRPEVSSVSPEGAVFH